MDVDFEFTVARLAKIANDNNFVVGLLGTSGPPRRIRQRLARKLTASSASAAEVLVRVRK
jgi:hypothetical protein